MIEAYGELQFNLDFYTDGGDLSRLADVINDVRCASALLFYLAVVPPVRVCAF